MPAIAIPHSMARFRRRVNPWTGLRISMVRRDLGTNQCKIAKCKQLRNSKVRRDLGANPMRSGAIDQIANQYSTARFRRESGNEYGSNSGGAAPLENEG